jgi:hypothetical protein
MAPTDLLMISAGALIGVRNFPLCICHELNTQSAWHSLESIPS